MKKPIRFDEAMRILDASNTATGYKPFLVVFCTANRGKDTGGERIIFERAVLNAKRKTAAVNSGVSEKIVRREKRYPVNIRNMTSNEIRKVNLDLIEYINDHPVI